MQRVIIFDDGKGELGPLTDLRAAFDVRTGALTTLERLRRALRIKGPVLHVPDSLRALTRQAHAEPVNATLNLDGPTTLINGRCVLPPAVLGELKPGQMVVEAGSGELVGGCLGGKEASAYLRGAAPGATVVAELPAPALLARPWHVRSFRDRAIEIDLRLLAQPEEELAVESQPEDELFEVPGDMVPTSRGAPEAVRIEGHPLTIGRGARVYPGSVLDLERGPIVLGECACVRPGAVVIGPAYIGPNTVVLERATIRGNTAIGPWCKVNGEVAGTIFQGYTNKSHDGFLGDSWVGEWVNLGAGTTNSNLLNTYGEVITRATPDGRRERTGEQFLGAIIGDHVKTAICTRLMTGCVLGTGGMFATTAPVSGATPRFCWRTDEGERAYRLDKFMEVARAVMGRRKVEPTGAYEARLTELIGLTSLSHG